MHTHCFSHTEEWRQWLIMWSTCKITCIPTVPLEAHYCTINFFACQATVIVHKRSKATTILYFRKTAKNCKVLKKYFKIFTNFITVYRVIFDSWKYLEWKMFDCGTVWIQYICLPLVKSFYIRLLCTLDTLHNTIIAHSNLSQYMSVNLLVAKYSIPDLQ